MNGKAAIGATSAYDHAGDTQGYFGLGYENSRSIGEAGVGREEWAEVEGDVIMACMAVGNGGWAESRVLWLGGGGELEPRRAIGGERYSEMKVRTCEM